MAVLVLVFCIPMMASAVLPFYLVYQKDGAVAGDQLGISVAGIGDANGDGKADFIVGAYTAGSNGKAYVYSGVDGTLLYQKTGSAAGDQFGYSVAEAGDINGDGKADFIVGAPGNDFFGTDNGAAYVYSGANGALIWQFFGGTSPGEEFGYSVGGLGDVNNDGKSEFVVGSPFAKPGGVVATGSAFAYSGGTATLLYQKNGSADFDLFGGSVAGTGDVNGDGKGDFIVGSSGADPGGLSFAGSAFVYSGSTGAFLFQKDGAAASDAFGGSVNGAGDMNADGKADVIIGAPGASPGGRAGAGSAYVYSGVGPADSLLYQKDGAVAGDGFGHSVAGAGNADGGTKGDFLVGAYTADSAGLVDRGSAYLYSGESGFLQFKIKGSAGGDQMGSSVAGLGDINCDGIADFIIGAFRADPGGRSNAGSAFVYTYMVDTDGDGLFDPWELCGVDGLNLPAMGASSTRKDIFVEVDWMVGAHDHKPKRDAISTVVQAFANAPVANPVGPMGITLHVDTGQFGGGNSVAEVAVLGSFDGSGNYIWSAFDGYKSANFAVNRRRAFRYCLFAHDFESVHHYSGIARGTPASDFLVTLGGWDDNVGSVKQQAGTFMHELGHTLGLHHGGANDTNYKPNYLSIMSYAFQTYGLRYNGNDGLFDYSKFSLNNLVETNLNEMVGLSGDVNLTASYGTRYYCSGAPQTISNATGSIDWNCNGSITNPVTSDINKDGGNKTLTTQNDWAVLKFKGGTVGAGDTLPTPPMSTPADEASKAELDSACIARGDLNEDGVYTSSDVVLEVNFVFLGTPVPAGDLATDVNCDGISTASDVVQELNWVFLGEPRPCCL